MIRNKKNSGKEKEGKKVLEPSELTTISLISRRPVQHSSLRKKRKTNIMVQSHSGPTLGAKNFIIVAYNGRFVPEIVGLLNHWVL